MLVRSRMLVTVSPAEYGEAAMQALQSAIEEMQQAEGEHQFLKAEVAGARRAGRLYIIFDIELDSVNEAGRISKKAAEEVFQLVDSDEYTLEAGSHFVIPV
ncbi:hypothetical protein CFREI_02355 [Corynebacterium freiburgense]|nr:hypothetical protein CFREI_02355 [Corynebacterium freiburgense]